MRLAALLYHDVVADGGDPDASGFPGAGAAVYKLTESAFQAHLAALDARPGSPAPVRIADRPAPGAGPLQWLLTFDDGGISACRTADALAARGWTGHFFITAGRIGERGFVDAAGLRQLVRDGHVVGSHSWSHPPRISALPAARVREEWLRSVGTLEDLTGAPVRTASVPGGFYAPHVARAAAAAGIRVLFNSEPVLRCRDIDACLVVGRFSIQRESSAEDAVALAAGHARARLPAWLSWNARKLVKRVAGSRYERGREALLRRGADRRPR